MTKLDRRRFLARSGQAGLGAVAGTSLVGVPQPVRALGANEKIVLGIVGIRGRGHLLAMGFALRGDCEIAYMCDVDEIDRVPRSRLVPKREPALRSATARASSANGAGSLRRH